MGLKAEGRKRREHVTTLLCYLGNIKREVVIDVDGIFCQERRSSHTLNQQEAGARSDAKVRWQAHQAYLFHATYVHIYTGHY